MKKPLITKLKIENEMSEALYEGNGTSSGAKVCAEIAMKYIDYNPSIIELLAEISEHIRLEKGEQESRSFNLRFAQPFLTKRKIKK